MQKSNRLIITGIGSRNQAIIDELSQADVLISREGIALQWCEAHQFKKLIPLILDYQNDGVLRTIDRWIEKIQLMMNDHTIVAYVTVMTPILCDQLAVRLISLFDRSSVEIFPGDEMTANLITCCKAAPLTSVTTIDGLALLEKHHPPFNPADAVIIHYPIISADLKNLLKSIYPDHHQLYVCTSSASDICQWQSIDLKNLDQWADQIDALYIPPLAFDRSLENFQETIAHLRAPEGCPWDRKQTHASLRTYLLEETYEALDALDKNDIAGLREELGDLLLQILLHAQIASENGEFNMADVISGINQKIVYRHPHVFKDWVVKDEEDVIQNWESLKGLERKKNGDEVKGMLDGVPISFPSLAQAQAIQERAARVGFDWPDIKPVMDKVLEELEEVNTAVNDVERGKELGDLLFAMVNLIRWNKVDAESALRETNLKFRKRFAYIEKEARKAGKDLQQMTLDEMDKFWEQAKAFDD